MDFEQIKSSIKEISDIAESVPEKFRDKCFELLLNALLAGEKPPTKDPVNTKGKDTKDSPPKPSAGQVPMNAPLRVFLRKTDLSEEDLNKVLHVEDGEVHFIEAPKSDSNAQGQLDWSLLLALRNAILKESFETDPEEVRSKCIAVGVYDKSNFAAHFKKERFRKMFKDELTSQGKAVTLSPEGQDALGVLVKSLASAAK